MSGTDCYRMNESPAARELRRRIRREAIMEWIGGALLAVLGVVYCASTPIERNGGCLMRDDKT